MSMAFQLAYIVIKATHLSMIFWSICTPCMDLNSQQPHHTIHMEIHTAKVFNHTLHNLLKTFNKEQKPNWPIYLSSLMFAYNAMLHIITGNQPFKFIFSHKAPTVCDAWLRLAKYNDQYSQSKSAWVNEQHELILAVNRWALKNIRQTVKKTALHARGSPLDIPKDNLVLLRGPS